MRVYLYYISGLLVLLLLSCRDTTQDPLVSGAVDTVKLFTLLEPESCGVSFSNDLKENEFLNIITFEYFYNGGGVALGDINNDGLADIYFSGNQVGNKLYLNQGGLAFKDITTAAGLSGSNRWSTGVTMADINGDGWLDIYVCNSGKVAEDQRRNELFINNGDLTFTEQAAVWGVDDAAYSTQGLFLDYDGDNDLDLFLLNRPTQIFLAEEALVWRSRKDDTGGDKLFRNVGGKFQEVSALAGIHQNGLGYGLGVTAGDLNKDGLIDIYVANDYIEPDYLYLNLGDGTFQDVIMEATNHISNFGMGVDIADINNDSWPDIFVADMAAADNYRQKTNMRPMDPQQFNWAVDNGFHHQYMYNTLQLNQGNMMFSEIAQMAGISNTDWSWATLFADFDNDGWNDLLITNGFRKEFSNKDFIAFSDKIFRKAMNLDRQDQIKAMQEVLSKLPETKLSNYIYRNKGDLTFEPKVVQWGLDVPSYSNGAAVGDLDNDGDLDLVINNIDAPAHIFRNNLQQSQYLRIKFTGPPGNNFGIGAAVSLFAGSKTYYKELVPTRGYQSSVEPVLHFGLEDAAGVDSLLVIWPDGKQQSVKGISAGNTITINYKQAQNVQYVPEKPRNAIFKSITAHAGLTFNHTENDFDDFEGEILLPHRMSRQGPALAVADINGDGREDFYIGGATGKNGWLYTQDTSGEFTIMASASFSDSDAIYEDVGAAFFDADNDGDQDLYVVSGGNEYPSGDEYYQDRLYFNQGEGRFTRAPQALPVINSSGSVVRPFDYDNDGDIDLFVGGRQVPGHYPMPAKSYLLSNEGGTFKDVTELVNPDFNALGMVTDATWADLDGDSHPELVVVGEWMPILIYEYIGGALINETVNYGLDQETGWWSSIAVTDYNADGKQDLVAGNLGLNYKYKASKEAPFHVYYGDYDGNGRGDIILGYFNGGELYPLRGKQCSTQQMPLLGEKFKTYDAFGSATLVEVYGQEFLENALHYQATNFASVVLQNEGSGKFRIFQLPARAQISCINSIITGDFDEDGITDLLTAGNNFHVEVETIRNDASLGLFLKGFGGDFLAVDPMTSGFIIPGDVRHMQKIKLNNGSWGVLIAKNSDSLQLMALQK